MNIEKAKELVERLKQFSSWNNEFKEIESIFSAMAELLEEEIGREKNANIFHKILWSEGVV